ncbi:11799_t:CDS:2, partial [Racocetra fulgida]
VGDEFPTVESFKEAAQEGAKAAVAYAEKMNEVEKAFNEVNKAAMKSRDPKYIQTYFEEWKNDAESEGSHSALKKAIEAASGLEQLEEKYENLNDSGSKATFLHKIEALASEEIVIPKAPLPNAPKKKHPTSTKRDPLLSEIQDKAAIKKEKTTKKKKIVKEKIQKKQKQNL